jgi:hypothetical protein
MTLRSRWRDHIFIVAFLFLSLAGVRPALGQHRWQPPLDRIVTVHARDVSLRDALARVAAAAGLRLSYSAELLPLDRRVLVSFDSVAVGEALTLLLRGTLLKLQAVGADHVVLAPENVDSLGLGTRRVAVVLDQVVVTGSAAGASERSLPLALGVVRDGTSARLSPNQSLSDMIDGGIPGVWIWAQSPLTSFVRFASIRGATSFGSSYPKMYIDGIEVANPLVVTQLTPGMIERIEVIRGPQGAALYGTDAISGVVNIVTRSSGSSHGIVDFDLRSDAGVAASTFGSSSLAQTHSLVMRAGSSTRSGEVGGSISTVGDFIPDAHSRQTTLTGSGRIVNLKAIFAGTARFFSQDAKDPVSPLFGVGDTAADGNAILGNGAQTVRQYTAGGTATFIPSEQWTHTFIAGIDGSRLSSVPDGLLPIPSVVDASLRRVRSDALRGTFRARSVLTLSGKGPLAGSVIFGAEQSLLWAKNDWTYVQTPPSQGGGAGDGSASNTLSSTSGLMQTTASFRDVVHLTGGVRVERNEGFASSDKVATLPLVGVSLVQVRGDASMKFRAAYGKGVRPQRTAARESSWQGPRADLLSSTLEPEEQSGYEVGFDIFAGRALTLRVTRFNQTASGLIQMVATGVDESGLDPEGRGRVDYTLQNVGSVSNKGWEMDGAVAKGPASLAVTFTSVDSRVRSVNAGYLGDLAVGDRVLEVPRTTASAKGNLSLDGWLATVGVTRAFSWMNYDRLALARAVAIDPLPSAPLGSWLRSYWMEYDGVTRLDASVTRMFGSDLSLVLTGVNLFNRQRGEPDNFTILPGRTFTLGIRALF